jgi:hypothetical protein
MSNTNTNRADLVTAAIRNGMEVDMPDFSGIRVRHNRTGGYWVLVRTVSEIEALFA